jgi:hypothetical protein
MGPSCNLSTAKNKNNKKNTSKQPMGQRKNSQAKFRNSLNLTESKSKTCRNLQDATKTVIRENFIVLNLSLC